MPDDDLTPAQPDSPDPAAVVGSFRIVELVVTAGDVRLYRARDEQVDRRVLLRVAGEAGAVSLLDDARRIAAVSHPGLVAVLGAGQSESGAYAAVQDLDARPLSEAGALSSQQAARVAIDIAGAIGALSQAGLRAPVDTSSVLVVGTHDGVRGLLDPLRVTQAGESCLTDADPQASTNELANLLERAVPAPSDALRSAIDGVRSGISRAPAELAAALAPLAAPPRHTRRRRPALIAAACFAVAIIAAGAVVLHERSDEAPRPVATAPAARIVTRIPLGIGGQELPLALAFLGRTAWIGTTAGRLLKIDTATNQVSGNPIRLAGQHPISAMVASGGKLYASDFAGWLLRIEPGTGAVTGRRRLGESIGAMQTAGGALWLATEANGKGQVVRVDPATLKPIGTPLKAVPGPRYLGVQGQRAWVLGGDVTGEVARVDFATGKRALAWVGPQVITGRLAGGTLWITDQFDGTVSALDAERMVFTRGALPAPRTARGVLERGRDVWFTSSDALTSSGRLRLERFDVPTGRRVGRAVPLGRTADYAMTLDRGTLWILTSSALLRLAPTAPRPALGASPRSDPPPHALVAGPLRAATWRTPRFAVPFTFTTPAFEWLGTYPLTDSVTLLAARNRSAELDVSAPRQVFVNDQELSNVGDPPHLLALLRRNPRLVVGEVRHVQVAGRPALQFELRANHPIPHPEVCGDRPCALLFPVKQSTGALADGIVVRLSLLRSGDRTIVISEGDGRAALALTAPLLATFRFPA